MTALVRPRSLAACALFVAATAGFLAPPAQADAPRVTFRTPGHAQKLQLSSFEVSALVEMAGTLTGDITLEVKSLDVDAKQVPVTASVRANGRSSQEVAFPVAVEYNGKYLATVRATGKDNPKVLIEDDNPETGTATREFFVAAPPARPTNVRPVIDPESRIVTLSWSPNPEKDLLFYVVQRAKGDGDFAPLGRTDGTATSIVDPSTAEAGGEYRYQVAAVRRGAKADEGVNSDPSPVAKATVPPPPGPSTTVAGGTTASTTPAGAGGDKATASTAGGSTATPLASNSPGALRKSGTIDLSGFSSIQSQARRPASRSVEPDTGFTEVLPFGPTNTTRLLGEEEAGAPEEGGAAGGDEPEVRELGAEEASNDRQRSAAFLAAGLLATVLLMHLLWIKGEVQREPLEALVPE